MPPVSQTCLFQLFSIIPSNVFEFVLSYFVPVNSGILSLSSLKGILRKGIQGHLVYSWVMVVA